MGEYSLFMDCKTNYCWDAYASQLDPQIGRTPNQNSSKLVHRYWHTDPKVYMEKQRPRIVNIESFGGMTLFTSRPTIKLQQSKQCSIRQRIHTLIMEQNIESPEIGPNTVNWPLTKEQLNEQRNLFNKWYWSNWTSTLKRN